MTAIAMPPVLVAPSLPHQYTDEELITLADDGASEFIDGRLVEKQMGYDATWTALELGFQIKLFLRSHPIGEAVVEQSFRCFPDDPAGFRRPDIAFLAAGRVPSPAPPGPLTVVPDLAIEVASPSDQLGELELKLAAYRSVAVPLVWVVIPAVRLVRVFPRGGPNLELVAGDTLTGGDVLPGFSVPVADLFRPVPPQG